ncbi:hypothetical protein P8452_64536 [Trifolium repens]|nr:hypothetical protein P8452_64536 [Trifolium repens]
MDNYVICAIYGLPDVHEHIIRSPHYAPINPRGSYSCRRYEESRRDNRAGSCSSRELREASHRIVVNSS